MPRRCARAVARVFTTTRATRELETLATATQRPVTTGRRIVVTSVRGGAGKTATATLLASVLAARRRDPVLLADADPVSGCATARLECPAGAGLPELARTLAASRGGPLTGLGQLLPRTSTGLWIVPGGTGGGLAHVRDVTRALSRLFAVQITDTGPEHGLPKSVELADEAHAIIVVVPATPDGVRSTATELHRMAGEAQGRSLLARVVLAVNPTGPPARSALRASGAKAMFGQFGLPLAWLSYDRHLAAGAPIQVGALAEPTVLAGTRLAGLALDKSLRA
jgi:MinD-like ATPase involved in chromosome partitioning or flagellar assembly